MYKKKDDTIPLTDEGQPLQECLSKELSDKKDADYEKPYLRLRDESSEGDLWCD
jgi:hypothetical protein